MGTFRYPMDIGDPAGQHFERVEALVDTGAAYSIAPAALLSSLGVTVLERRRFLVADGRATDQEVGQTWVRVDGRSVIRLVVFGHEEVGAVLGADTLEGLGLGVDVIHQRLIPIPVLPLLGQRRTGPPQLF